MRRGSFGNPLLATDFSPGAGAALRWAVAVARGHESHLTLVHVLPAPRRAENAPALEREAERRLRALGQSVEAAGVPVAAVRREGRPWEVIIDAARETGADLIVLGTRGHSRSLRLTLGRTADRVVRCAEAPVLAVPSRALGGPENGAVLEGPVLIATDFSEAAARAGCAAARLARALAGTARLVLLHACDFPVDYGIASGAEVVAAARSEEETAARRTLETIAMPLRDQGFDVDVVVREGDAATVIEEKARSLGAGLIALGTHGRSGLRRLLLGSVAEGVLHHAPCPVLTVQHAGERVEPGAGPAARGGRSVRV